MHGNVRGLYGAQANLQGGERFLFGHQRRISWQIEGIYHAKKVRIVLALIKIVYYYLYIWH